MDLTEKDGMVRIELNLAQNRNKFLWTW